MVLKLQYGHPKVSDADLNRSIAGVLDDNRLLTLATVGETGPHVNNAYFCYSTGLHVYFFSDPATEHGRNIDKNPQVAVNVADTHQDWESKKRGVQMVGSCRRATPAETVEAVELFFKRFPGFVRKTKRAGEFMGYVIRVRPYRVQVERLKLFDETTFGREERLELQIKRS